ncbi:GNAT family protein [Streptomyces luteireticuli]|uniref:GNAT family N-acetyltransferase n=1 Tax=Streptomyces luteireticuli TaxID=173858 RepID=A0ABN0YZ62_9ACTN
MSPESAPLTPGDLRGHGLRLRTWYPHETDAVLRGVTDPDFLRWNVPRLPVKDAADAAQWIRARAEGWERNAFGAYCIADGSTDAPLGDVFLNLLNPLQRIGGVGYWVLPEARGRGVARHALELITRWGFDSVGLHRIELGHAVGHEASCRIAARVGYAVEGTQRGALYRDGRRDAYRDRHLHARLATDRPPTGR